MTLALPALRRAKMGKIRSEQRFSVAFCAALLRRSKLPRAGKRAGPNWLFAVLLSLAFTAALPAASPSRAEAGIAPLLQETQWGESSEDLFHRFGAAAMRLQVPLDFGDSYARIVLPNATLGGVPVVVFFQMDKKTHGLLRIQIERPPHGVNPPAFRAIAAALNAELGPPDQICGVPPVPESGWQAAAEERWRRGDVTISAIFRDTTLQAFEGCLYGPATGWCGLHGQLLVRLGPSDRGAGPCSRGGPQ
jgi:hypothetical protein